jgi:hypothetical protein
VATVEPGDVLARWWIREFRANQRKLGTLRGIRADIQNKTDLVVMATTESNLLAAKLLAPTWEPD